jgi:hypothetical protein
MQSEADEKIAGDKGSKPKRGTVPKGKKGASTSTSRVIAPVTQLPNRRFAAPAHSKVSRSTARLSVAAFNHMICHGIKQCQPAFGKLESLLYHWSLCILCLVLSTSTEV